MKALLALLLALWVGDTRAAEPRWALILGNNRGLADDGPLKFAQRDAERIESALLAVGGFARERVVTLNGGDATVAKMALNGLEAAIIAADEPGAVLFVFYSGHADAVALRLAGTTWPIDELTRAIKNSKAPTRVVVLDACRSGAVTRVKGGVAGPSFAIALDDQMVTQGTAVLASTAAGEDALESDELQASFFTHHFVSALHGAADGDGDGRVTVSEAFQYASEHTLASTASTMAGPQHPTYRLELGGRHELVLSRPGLLDKALGIVELSAKGAWILRRADRNRVIVGEVVVTGPPRRIAVTPGAYRLTRRTEGFVAETTTLVKAGEVTTVDPSLMQRHGRSGESSKGERSFTSPSESIRLMEERASLTPEPHETPAPVPSPGPRAPDKTTLAGSASPSAEGSASPPWRTPAPAATQTTSSAPSPVWGAVAGGAALGNGGGGAFDLGVYYTSADLGRSHLGLALSLDSERVELVGLSVGGGFHEGDTHLDLRAGLGLIGDEVTGRLEFLVGVEPVLKDGLRLRFAGAVGLVVKGDAFGDFVFGRLLIGFTFGR